MKNEKKKTLNEKLRIFDFRVNLLIPVFKKKLKNQEYPLNN
jgi:hypothetical protein